MPGSAGAPRHIASTTSRMSGRSASPTPASRRTGSQAASTPGRSHGCGPDAVGPVEHRVHEAQHATGARRERVDGRTVQVAAEAVARAGLDLTAVQRVEADRRPVLSDEVAQLAQTALDGPRTEGHGHLRPGAGAPRRRSAAPRRHRARARRRRSAARRRGRRADAPPVPVARVEGLQRPEREGLAAAPRTGDRDEAGRLRVRLDSPEQPFHLDHPVAPTSSECMPSSPTAPTAHGTPQRLVGDVAPCPTRRRAPAAWASSRGAYVRCGLGHVAGPPPPRMMLLRPGEKHLPSRLPLMPEVPALAASRGRRRWSGRSQDRAPGRRRSRPDDFHPCRHAPGAPCRRGHQAPRTPNAPVARGGRPRWTPATASLAST